MGSSGEAGNSGIDASVGALVWVRRRNGSWWPGRILGPDELTEDYVVSPRAGTPVKLLGRDDASVDWYNLERSKRVKAFRCGEYDECIAKAMAAASNPNKKAVKYARREDAIIHALEIENERLGKVNSNFSSRTNGSAGDCDCPPKESPAPSHSVQENEDMTDNVSHSQENSDSALELSQSGISFEEPNHISSSKLQTMQGRRRRTPNDSEDDGKGVKRMRGLRDLGVLDVVKRPLLAEELLEIVQQDSASKLDSSLQTDMVNGSPANGSKGSPSLKRKRSQVATANEILKRKNRRRTLTKVLESSEMVSVPAACDQLPNSCGSPLQLADGMAPDLEPNDSNRCLNGNHTGVSCEIVVTADPPEPAVIASSDNDMKKENEIPSISGLVVNDSSSRFLDVPSVGEGKPSSGNSPVLFPCSSGRPEIGALGMQSSHSHAKAASLRRHRRNESGSTGSAAVLDISQSMEKGCSKWQSKGKRNARLASKDRKHGLRKYMNMDDLSNPYLAGIKHSDMLCHVSDQKLNCNGISGSAAYNFRSQGKSKQVAELSDGRTQRSRSYRQSRFMVPARYQTSDSNASNNCSDGSLYDVKLEVKARYRPQHVPLVSLTSKMTGKAIVGHPITAEVLDDGYCDILYGSTECDLGVQQNAETGRIPTKCLGSPKRSPKSKKSGLLPKKIRKLSSLTRQKQLEERKLLPKATVPACIPLKLVFSRINEAVSGLARPTPTHPSVTSSET